MKCFALVLMFLFANITSLQCFGSPRKKITRRRKNNRSYRCPDCASKTYSCVFGLERHRRTHHKEGVSHQCLSCPYSSRDISNLRKHVRINHPDTIGKYFESTRGQRKKKRRQKKISKAKQRNVQRAPVQLLVLATASSSTSNNVGEDSALSTGTTPTSPLQFHSPLSSSNQLGGDPSYDWPVNGYSDPATETVQ